MACALLFNVTSYAQTSDNIIQIGPVKKDGKLQERTLSYVVIDGVQYGISPGFVIYDFNQSFMPLMTAPVKWPKIKYLLDLYGQIHRIWLLEENK